MCPKKLYFLLDLSSLLFYINSKRRCYHFRPAPPYWTSSSTPSPSLSPSSINWTRNCWFWLAPANFIWLVHSDMWGTRRAFYLFRDARRRTHDRGPTILPRDKPISGYPQLTLFRVQPSVPKCTHGYSQKVPLGTKDVTGCKSRTLRCKGRRI